MATLVAIFCLITVFVAIPLTALKPKWVFYIFITSAVFNNILAGFINQAGNLGLPMTWGPADFLSVLTLFAAFFIRREKYHRSNIITKCIIILVVLSFISLVQGMLLFPRDALTHSRVVHFAAAAIFALRYFTDYSRVRGFLKFSVFLLLIMFAVHIMVRFDIFEPPINDAGRIVETRNLAGERGTYSLVPMLYIVLVSFAIGRLVSKTGFSFISVFLLLIGLAGVVLSETRSTYGAVAVLMLASLIFLRGRMKNFAIYTIVGMMFLCAATAVGIDFLSRFRTNYGWGDYSLPTYHEFKQSWRGIEYGTIVSSYQKQPYFLLTGRGVGAMHHAPAGASPMVAFYHSEYLGWLDRTGIIGLVTVLILFFACLWRALALTRSDFVFMRYLGATFFLLLIALAADGVFHPIFSHYRAAAMLICFAAITANWRDIYLSIDLQEELLIDNAMEEILEPEPAPALAF